MSMYIYLHVYDLPNYFKPRKKSNKCSTKKAGLKPLGAV